MESEIWRFRRRLVDGKGLFGRLNRKLRNQYRFTDIDVLVKHDVETKTHKNIIFLESNGHADYKQYFVFK